jgi:hypothetical protein
VEAPTPEALLQQSRVKSDRELQTVCRMVGGENNEWGATRILHGRRLQHSLPATARPFFLFSVFTGMVPPFSPFLMADRAKVSDLLMRS